MSTAISQQHQLAVQEIGLNYTSLSIVCITQIFNEDKPFSCMIFKSTEFPDHISYKNCRTYLQLHSGAKLVLRRLLFEVNDNDESNWRAEFTANKSEKTYENEKKIQLLGKRKFLEEKQIKDIHKVSHVEVKRDGEVLRVMTHELKTTDVPRKVFTQNNNITRKLFNSSRVNKRILFQLLKISSVEYIRSQYSKFIKVEDIKRPVKVREVVETTPDELEIHNPTGLVQNNVYDKIEDDYIYSNLTRSPELIEMAFDYLSSRYSEGKSEPVCTIKTVPSEVYRIKLQILGITDEDKLKNIIRKFFSCDSEFKRALRVRNAYLNLVEESTGKATKWGLKYNLSLTV